MVAREAGDSETGTGLACAKLSEILPAVAYAPVVSDCVESQGWGTM